VLFLFISAWGIITGYVMVHKSFYQGQIPEHPFSLVNQQLAGTYTRMESLDRLVVLSPGVLLQYQKVQAQQLWLEKRPKQGKSNECEKQEEIDRHFDEFFLRTKNRHLKLTNTRSSSTVGRISQFMKRSKILSISIHCIVPATLSSAVLIAHKQTLAVQFPPVPQHKKIRVLTSRRCRPIKPLKC
jgi:hypothetical protein